MMYLGRSVQQSCSQFLDKNDRKNFLRNAPCTYLHELQFYMCSGNIHSYLSTMNETKNLKNFTKPVLFVATEQGKTVHDLLGFKYCLFRNFSKVAGMYKI